MMITFRFSLNGSRKAARIKRETPFTSVSNANHCSVESVYLVILLSLYLVVLLSYFAENGWCRNRDWSNRVVRNHYWSCPRTLFVLYYHFHAETCALF